MITRTTRHRVRLGALVASAALVAGGVVAAGGAAQAKVAAPVPKAVDVATKAVALTWAKTGEDAYRLRMATNSSMTTGVDTWDVLGNYYEWTRTDASPSQRAPRLTPGKKYYFQVKAITRAADGGDRENITSYGKVVGVTLPKSGSPELKPVDVKTTTGGADTVYISWSDRGPGYSYVLRYTPNPNKSVLKWSSIKTDNPSATIKRLKPGRTYYFRPRVIDSKGKAQSAYAASGPKATTLKSTPSPGLSVATYNVRKMYSTSDWAKRRKPVADNIKAAAPDVIAVQEAIPKTWATNGKKQHADLMSLLGSPYSYVTSGSGSSGTQLAYNKNRLTVSKQGIKMLYEHGSAERYAVWALFKDKISGKTFFAVSTHLEPGSTTSTLNDVRKKQAGEIVDLIKANAGGRPAMILGDMNTSRSAEPSNGQYEVFTDAGYVDPIDNDVATWASGDDATAEHIVDAQYSSANKLTKQAPLSSFPNGTHIDYTYVSPNVRVALWRQVLKLDTSGSFVGTIPSDHNLMQMTVHLP